MKNHRILANCTVTKLKELSKSYGKPEEIKVPFIFEYADKIEIMNVCGCNIRTLKKGTKLLISYTGTEISEKAYNLRINKASKELAERNREREAAQQAQQGQIEALKQGQTEILRNEFLKNTDFLNQITHRIETESNKHWRGWVKMKVCAKLFDGQFNKMALTPTIIRDVAFSVKKDTNFYFAVYDKEDTYVEDECLESFDTEDEAINFVNEQNAGYGYNKFYYKTIEK